MIAVGNHESTQARGLPSLPSEREDRDPAHRTTPMDVSCRDLLKDWYLPASPFLGSIVPSRGWMRLGLDSPKGARPAANRTLVLARAPNHPSSRPHTPRRAAAC